MAGEATCGKGGVRGVRKRSFPKPRHHSACAYPFVYGLPEPTPKQRVMSNPPAQRKPAVLAGWPTFERLWAFFCPGIRASANPHAATTASSVIRWIGRAGHLPAFEAHKLYLVRLER